MRKYNFHAGPATLPESILRQAQTELLDWQGRGVSVMEISHRSQPFVALMESALEKLRRIYAVPANYKIIFTAAPARAHYALVPMNLLGNKNTADYLITGYWSMLAQKEAARYCDPRIVCNSQSSHYTRIPDVSTWQLNPDAAYCNYITNETIHGVQFHSIPDVGTVPLIADMTSDFLSYPLDISRFGMIFAGTQKNVGPSGMTILVIRDDLLDKELPITPSCFSYQKQAAESSLMFTSISFCCYMADLMFDWIEAHGGLQIIAEQNRRRAEAVYAVIDSGDFYRNLIPVENRSISNIPFQLPNDTLTATFIQEAEKNNLIGLRGHRQVGGIRASLYNSQTDEAVAALTNFMRDFEQHYG